MHSVMVRIFAAEFSATMTAIREWLDANRYEPTRYKYDHNEDAVLVTVDFPTGVAAKAFAVRFDGAYRTTGSGSVGATFQLGAKFGVGRWGGIEKTSLISLTSEERRTRPHMAEA
jgi:hypothetical protein